MSIQLHTALQVPEGDNITVKRLMPVGGLRNFDPFVLWDHFDIAAGGFPPHPHRGFEAITWMFAGGMQLWINLPQRLKGMDADYQQVEAVPAEEKDGVHLQCIVGHQGAIQLHTDVEYLDMVISPGSRMQRNIAEGWRGIVYVIEGIIEVGGVVAEAAQALLVENEMALEVTSQNGARLMWCFGAPHHEPIHQHGPFVD